MIGRCFRLFTRLSVALNPWRRARELERKLNAMSCELTEVSCELIDARRERDVWRHHAELMGDRYEKIRGTAQQLREALALHRPTRIL
jgi:hypothetical protein